jgi:hypothetical protein
MPINAMEPMSRVLPRPRAWSKKKSRTLLSLLVRFLQGFLFVFRSVFALSKFFSAKQLHRSIVAGEVQTLISPQHPITNPRKEP